MKKVFFGKPSKRRFEYTFNCAVFMIVQFRDCAFVKAPFTRIKNRTKELLINISNDDDFDEF